MNADTTAPAPATEAPAPIMPNPFQRRILAALNVARFPSALGPSSASIGHIYAGTVPAAEVARRRRVNKAARRARATHRRAA
ncbi:hypothetical protein [Arthrobacter phage SWEP2]|uniref:Uncharacterized protein n=1 Tax=Arthrobacter phage SWEP2 TaxID=2945958 RepID=A0A9E7MJ34_9CAUD|nr:hypothetical protein [Arthrobacter phage SWEP2]